MLVFDRRVGNEACCQDAYAPTDTLILHGLGPPGASCGLSRSPFRPSDDSTLLPFLVPANAMAAVELRHVALMRLGSSKFARSGKKPQSESRARDPNPGRLFLQMLSLASFSSDSLAWCFVLPLHGGIVRFG